MKAGELIKSERVKRKWSQHDLGRRVGISQPAIKKIEAGETIKSAHLPRIAQELGIPLHMLDATLNGRRDGVNHNPDEIMNRGNVSLQTFPAEQLMGRTDLPVFSIVQGGRGALVLSSEPFTRIGRPHHLQGLKDAYGVLVKGNSMAREYNENDIAYVDPNLHPKKGDPCVFQRELPDGTIEAMIKYLERSPDASETLYYLSQTNPVKSFTVKKADWQKCHVAVGKQSGR